ncbi:hypothetical protein DFP72DRAFT_854292 [Ephemerocybe angulata]|uniref:Uncharacterized protein n=1 Tax=Ephemerocybe angulata TaxID=980116 RepID=A0A8H6HJJ2_9AGAR|nr:hypothetical protein DFP72DRAFT_854292 [Tulosesus angulatus]
MSPSPEEAGVTRGGVSRVDDQVHPVQDRSGEHRAGTALARHDGMDTGQQGHGGHPTTSTARPRIGRDLKSSIRSHLGQPPGTPGPRQEAGSRDPPRPAIGKAACRTGTFYPSTIPFTFRKKMPDLHSGYLPCGARPLLQAQGGPRLSSPGRWLTAWWQVEWSAFSATCWHDRPNRFFDRAFSIRKGTYLSKSAPSSIEFDQASLIVEPLPDFFPNSGRRTCDKYCIKEKRMGRRIRLLMRRTKVCTDLGSIRGEGKEADDKL